MRGMRGETDGNLAHHGAGLVEDVEIAVEDTVFGTHVQNQLEPRANHGGIFAEGTLEVVRVRTTRAELFPSLDKSRRPSGPDPHLAACREYGIRHCFHIADRGRKSSVIPTNNVLYDYVLFYLGQQTFF